MKIIRTDNYARETVSERLVAENIKNESYARVMCEALRASTVRSDEDWFEVKPDDYQLYVFEP